MEDWHLFVFKKGRKHYLVPAESEDNAWNLLQKRLSWKMEVVKKSCALIQIMNCNSEILSLN
jgi:hypothetical protein